MASRDFDTCTWSDKWFRSLSTVDLKLLFIYLWTNDLCNPAGCYEIDPELVELQCKVSLNGNADGLKPKVEYFPDYSIVWIKNFFRRQCKNPSFAISAFRSLKRLPPEIISTWHQYNSKKLKSLGLNTQCRDGVITVSPTVATQPYKTRPDKSKYSKEGSTDLHTGEQETHQGACPKCGKPKMKSWHELCDDCYRAKSSGTAQPSGKKVPPCNECGWQPGPGYKGMKNGICMDCRVAREEEEYIPF